MYILHMIYFVVLVIRLHFGHTHFALICFSIITDSWIYAASRVAFLNTVVKTGKIFYRPSCMQVLVTTVTVTS